MAADIGEMLFVDILRMSSYPGQPFTGNIFQDLILFLIVPTIFIIMVLYIATGRIIPDKKIRIMLGVGAYLFIVASGYYSAFALLAGPYFIFLIFILGLLGFVLGHFKTGGAGGGHYSGGGGNYSDHGGGFASSNEHMKKVGALDIKRKHQIEKDIRMLESEIKRSENRLKHLAPSNDRAIQAENDRIAAAERKIDEYRRMLERDPLDR